MDWRLVWQLPLGTMLLLASTALAGCAALDLLEGRAGDDEEIEPLVETQPYPPVKRAVNEPPAADPEVGSAAEKLAPVVSPAQAAKTSAATANSPARSSLSHDPDKAPTQPQPATTQTAVAAPDQESKSEPAAQSPQPPEGAEPAVTAASAEPAEASPAGGEAAPNDKSTAKPAESEPTQADRHSDILRRRDELIAALEDEVKLRSDKPDDEGELLLVQQQLRLLYLLAERPDDAVSEIASLPEAEQEAFKQLMFGLNTWLSPEEERRSNLRNARVLRSLKEATRELAAAAKLDVANLRFCESVEGFGWYKEFPTTQFRAKQQVILYAEVDNFTTEKKNADTYETELKVAYQIFDAGGTLVDERELPLDKEVCRNQRRDYFLAYRIYLPDGIPAGRYRLELTVEDLKAKDRYQGRKLGTGLIEFSIRQ